LHAPAIQEEIDGKNVDWLEKVSDEQYGHGPSTTQETKKTRAANDMNKEPSSIKKTFGDFSPKLVQLTDDVLFGDVWERPELSKRDRSQAVRIRAGNSDRLRRQNRIDAWSVPWV
jgi:4-carboxymuconolactone decarboxylase